MVGALEICRDEDDDDDDDDDDGERTVLTVAEAAHPLSRGSCSGYP